MRDPNRIPVVLAAVQEYWEKHPDMRFFQVVSALGYFTTGAKDNFYTEDDSFLEMFKEFREKSAKK